MLPVISRIPEADKMIEGSFYFIIHAPWQSGKTTFLQFLTKQINSEGERYALYCSLASLRKISDRKEAIDNIAEQINYELHQSESTALQDLAYTFDLLPKLEATVKIKFLLNYLSVKLDKDFVVFFDEADCLSEFPLITFLAQLRDGYILRKSTKRSKFPSSIALVGMRDIRDYLTEARHGAESSGETSPFNIKRKAFTLPKFSLDEVKTLYHQHTDASGQIFEPEAIKRAWYWSEGQPWLVNALALETVDEILNNDYSIAITKDLIDQAAEAIIKRRDTHIDSLLERLQERRVVEVMDSVFAGTPGKKPKKPSDRQYCIDLGLVVETDNQMLRPANPMYSEVMSRMLTDEIQAALDNQISLFQWENNGIIFMSEILKRFQSFWRENAFSFPLRINDVDWRTREVIQNELDSLPLAYNLNESDTMSFIGRVRNVIARQYDEAAYSLILMAYLQKVVNGGALVHRQFCQGRGSVDLCVIHKSRYYLVEVKLLGQKSLDESLNQLSGYLDTSGENEGWLVIFDRNRNKSWEEKITWNDVDFKGYTIHIVGC
jgi:hypothetical protein